jgi:ferritin-like metal-binding protein YciE
MEHLLIHGLQDIYYAEQQIVKSLPKLIEKRPTAIWSRG